MKHPPQNRRRGLQVRTWMTETNSRGYLRPQGIRAGSSDPERIDLDYDRVNHSGNPND
jgi:hypothetical protein